MNRTTMIGTLVLGALAVATLGWPGGDDDARQITATLADAGSLQEGNEVRTAGVPVGTIDEIRLEDGHARLTLQVEDGVLPLHEDARLKVRPVNLLGENFIELDPGSDSAPFMDKAVIPLAHTSSAVTLQDFLSTFQAPTAAGLATTVTGLGEGVQDSGGELALALRRLAPAMGDAQRLGHVLSAQNEVLDSLVARLDPVAGALANDDGRALAGLVRSTEQLLSAITADRAALEETLARLPGTLRSARLTLGELGGVARAGTPTLRAIRPVTDHLSQVTGELKQFADAADPALASLRPVLDHARDLLDAAAPVVAGLRTAGPDLARAARDLEPISRELLDEHLGDLMAFVRKWALSTNGRDALGHYFRGVVYVTPATLQDLMASYMPRGVTLPHGHTGDGDPLIDVPNLDPGGTVGNLLDGVTSKSPLNATGLTATQEQNLLGQLLGGDQ